MISKKPFPDESNREGIERMLLHAFEFALESGFLREDGGQWFLGDVRVEDLPVAGYGVPVVSMDVSGARDEGEA